MFPQPYFSKGYWPGTYFPPTGEPAPEGSMWANVTGSATLTGTPTADAFLEASLLGAGDLEGSLTNGAAVVSRPVFFDPSPPRKWKPPVVTVEIRSALSGSGEVAGKISWLVDDTDEALWLLMD